MPSTRTLSLALTVATAPSGGTVDVLNLITLGDGPFLISSRNLSSQSLLFAIKESVFKNFFTCHIYSSVYLFWSFLLEQRCNPPLKDNPFFSPTMS